MGYLDNSTITVDAILTKKGRQKLAQGQSLNITKFALGDDEIDYQLYEPAHPKGNQSADSAILALPITQASPDETQVLRYKILTLPKGATRIPTVNIGTNAITSYQTDGATAFNPNTNPAGNNSAGYTAVLADQRAGTLQVTEATSGGTTIPVFLGEDVTSTAQVVTGKKFTFTPNPRLTTDVATTITVYGNETGGSVSIPVTITYKATA